MLFQVSSEDIPERATRDVQLFYLVDGLRDIIGYCECSQATTSLSLHISLGLPLNVFTELIFARGILARHLTPERVLRVVDDAPTVEHTQQYKVNYPMRL